LSPPPIFLLQPLGVFQQATDFVPYRHLHKVSAHLGVGTDALPTKPIGIGAQTAIIRIGSRVSFATARTNRLTIVGIATHFTDQEALE
jgi:hypothetical protein